jgi:release factor glutamine methyltransferase
LYAVDIDDTAVDCARRNVTELANATQRDGVTGTVLQGDLFQALPSRLQGRVNILVANAPYVPTASIALMPPEARLHEAPVALDGGADGLDILRRVISGAPDWLAEQGAMFCETSARQEPELRRLIAGAGMSADLAACEERQATVVMGIRAA